MFKHIAYQSAAVAAAVALSGLCAGGAGASVTATGAGRPTGQAAVTAGTAGAVPGTQLWVARYHGPANGGDAATAVAVSPGGGRVFVAGNRKAANRIPNYATVAYRTATGAQLWVHAYNGPANDDDRVTSMAVNPSGGAVYVTGYSKGVGTHQDYATVAYNAATGAQLWVQRYNDPANYDDWASSVAVSPSGGTVYVTGTSGAPSGGDYATVAYNAATGAQLWVQRYDGPGGRGYHASSVAVSPSGGTVYVTGYSYGGASGDDYATVAYNAATGAQLWVHRYNGPANGDDKPSSMAVSSGGVFVTGTSYPVGPGETDYATVAYNAATGAQLWVHRYNGVANGYDRANSVAVSSGGGTVYVTGYSQGVGTDADYATVAYNAATGTQLWVHGYNSPANSSDVANSVAVSPGGGTVYVTGYSYGGDVTSYDYATVAYDAATGTQLWVQRYNGPANNDDLANAVAVSPDGAKVFVTGGSSSAMASDYATVAYSG